MQSCTRAVRRSVCGARNAYSPANALRSTFATTSNCRQNEEDSDATSTTVAEQSELMPKSWRGSVARGSRGPVEHNGVAREPDDAPQLFQKVPPGPKWEARQRRDLLRRIQSAVAVTGDASQNRIDEGLKRGTAPKKQEKTTTPRVREAGSRYERTSSNAWQPFMARLRDHIASLKTGEGRNQLRGLSDEDMDNLRQSFDYTGLAILPHQSDVRPSLPIPWAISDTREREIFHQNGVAKDLLSYEIIQFAKYLTPTSVERAARAAIADELIDFITSTLMRDAPAKTGCEIFGSEKTGLAMPLSDIDVRIFDTRGREAMYMKNRMEHLLVAMRESDKYLLSNLRSTGRYPIINCQHRESGIDIQIVASSTAYRQVSFEQEITSKYLATTPNLREMFYVVRTMFAMRGLLDVYAGGIGSYGTFIMVLACMTRNRENLLGRDVAPSIWLRRFLRMYNPEVESAGIDTRRYGIAISPRFKFLKHDPDQRFSRYSYLARKRGDPIRAAQWTICQRKPFQPYLLTLQDPADPKNDLGKRTHAIKHIFATMGYYRMILSYDLMQIDECRKRGEAWKGESVLLPLVGRCHEIYAAHRRKLSEYGEKVLSLKGEDSSKT